MLSCLVLAHIFSWWGLRISLDLSWLDLR